MLVLKRLLPFLVPAEQDTPIKAPVFFDASVNLSAMVNRIILLMFLQNVSLMKS